MAKYRLREFKVNKGTYGDYTNYVIERKIFGIWFYYSGPYAHCVKGVAEKMVEKLNNK